MTYEMRHYFSRNFSTCNSTLDRELSVPRHEISDEDAFKFMSFLTLAGLKRHETRTQIFFDKRLNYNEVEEYIFYK